MALLDPLGHAGSNVAISWDAIEPRLRRASRTAFSASVEGGANRTIRRVAEDGAADAGRNPLVPEDEHEQRRRGPARRTGDRRREFRRNLATPPSSHPLARVPSSRRPPSRTASARNLASATRATGTIQKFAKEGRAFHPVAGFAPMAMSSAPSSPKIEPRRPPYRLLRRTRPSTSISIRRPAN